jgi:hypothetical protein
VLVGPESGEVGPWWLFVCAYVCVPLRGGPLKRQQGSADGTDDDDDDDRARCGKKEPKTTPLSFLLHALAGICGLMAGGMCGSFLNMVSSFSQKVLDLKRPIKRSDLRSLDIGYALLLFFLPSQQQQSIDRVSGLGGPRRGGLDCGLSLKKGRIHHLLLLAVDPACSSPSLSVWWRVLWRVCSVRHAVGGVMLVSQSRASERERQTRGLVPNTPRSQHNRSRGHGWIPYPCVRWGLA